MTIKAVLFDKDGTLIDFDITWGNATYDVFHELVEGDPAKMRQLADVTQYDLENRKIGKRSPLIGDSPLELAALWAEIAGRTPGKAFENEINGRFTTLSAKNVSGFTQTEPCLKYLKANGYLTGVATNDSEATAHIHMKKLGWHSYFDTIIGYDSGHGSKPGPGMVQAFISYAGIAPGECMMIGDSLHDIRAGRAAGSLTVGVATGPWNTDHLRSEADHVIETLEELPELVKRVNKQES